ncbi:MAG: hypothetical protein J7L96_10630 [Bacteroidales bacterium]|nr:hypothetical protein [Bacteroidales bacterium]
MNISGEKFTSLWYDEVDHVVRYIDQTVLPWDLRVKEMTCLDDAGRDASRVAERLLGTDRVAANGEL